MWILWKAFQKKVIHAEAHKCCSSKTETLHMQWMRKGLWVKKELTKPCLNGSFEDKAFHMQWMWKSLWVKKDLTTTCWNGSFEDKALHMQWMWKDLWVKRELTTTCWSGSFEDKAFHNAMNVKRPLDISVPCKSTSHVFIKVWYVQVILCQKCSFLHQLTQNMMADCSLNSVQENCMFSTYTHQIVLNIKTKTKNNLSSYFGLICARMSASNKELPVCRREDEKIW